MQHVWQNKLNFHSSKVVLPWRTQIENCFLSKSNIGLHTNCTLYVHSHVQPWKKSSKNTHTHQKSETCSKLYYDIIGFPFARALALLCCSFWIRFRTLNYQTRPLAVAPHPQAQSGLFRWPATSLKSFLDEICFQILTANFSSIFFFILHPICLCSLTTISKFCILFLSYFANRLLKIDLNFYVLLPAP